MLELDDANLTPAVRLNNGCDYVPTPRWITFGHHFAAIAGPGPLVGPVLAAPGISAARVAELTRLIWNDRVDALMTAVFIAVVVITLLDSLRLWAKLILLTRLKPGAAREAA